MADSAQPIPSPGSSPETLRALQAGARERRGEALEAIDRHRRSIWLRCLVQIMVVEWVAVALMLWSFHTPDLIHGQRAFWAALVLGDGGFLVLLIRTWRLVERSGPN